MRRPGQLSLYCLLLLAVGLAGGVGLGLRQAYASSGSAAAPSRTATSEPEHLSHVGDVARPAQLQWTGRPDAPRSAGPPRRVLQGAAARLVASVELVVRSSELNRAGLNEGRRADQPPVITSPPQGPPFQA